MSHSRVICIQLGPLINHNCNVLMLLRYRDKHFVSTEIHAFCDASQAAYCARIYIRCQDMLMLPLTFLTIPRLELSGAPLSELVNTIISSSFVYETINYWCDSIICISWIQTSPHKLKYFVANRVAQIQDISDPRAWKYMSTHDNPAADLLSRGRLSTAV